MKKIILYIKPYLLRMVGGFTIKATAALMDLGLPWVLAHMIDDIIPQKKLNLIFFWGIAMLLMAIGARQFNIIANRKASAVARDSVRILRRDLFVKMMCLSGKQIDEFTIPSLVSRMTTDTYNVHRMIGMMQRLGVRAPLILVGGIIITFTLEPILTLVLVGTLPFIILVVYGVSKKGVPLYGLGQTAIDKMVRVVRENIAGIRVVKSLSKGEYEKQRFERSNKEVVAREIKAASMMAIINPAMNLILNFGLTFVIVVGAYRVNSGASEVGKIVAFMSYFTMILNALISINRIFVMYSKASASGTRIGEVLDAPEELPVGRYQKVESPYHIEFKNVTFSYYASDNTPEEKTRNEQEETEQNIQNISFALKQGESLGIIGATGCGKTTLINLLMRFYDVDKGEILIHGKNIKGIPMAELREQFGVVFQNDILFSDTIEENINFWRNLPQKQVYKAAEEAQAAGFINELSDRYHSIVAAKGANLSGGQKQRILIARAMAGSPDILILDDSSSALDYKTDSLLRKAIREEYKNTTTLIIAQRISSIRSLDHIMVLEDGIIQGYGSHEELMENCTVYQEIYRSQMGGGDYGYGC